MRTAPFRDQHRCTRHWPLLLAAALAAWGGSVSVAAAAVHYVGPKGSDDGNSCLVPSHPCQTIAHAISRSLPGDEITLRAGTYLESGVTIPTGITLSGAGQGETIIDGELRNRVFFVSAMAMPKPFPMVAATAGPLIVKDLTITRGSTPGEDGGGAFLVLDGVLELVRVEITRSFAGVGGAVSCPRGCAGLVVRQSTLTENHGNYGGAIDTHGETLVENSTFSGNVAYEEDWGKGGAIRCSYATLTVLESELANNAATYEGGGIHAEGCTTRVENSTLVENWSSGDGGALSARYGGELVVINTTLSANTAEWTAGALAWDSTAVYIGNTTMVDNLADCCSGDDLFGSPLTLTNSIVTHPSRSSGAFYSFGLTPPAGSNNLIDGDDTNFPPGFRKGAITAGTIGALDSNGGPTRTHALLADSNAIDAVTGGCFDPRTGAAIEHDQRPAARPVGATALCDIGAFERR
jgi:predicted outer membrane repeat protein